MTEDANQSAPRIEALREAAKIIAGDRDRQYGAPEDNLGRIAAIWSVLFAREVTAADVAMAMVGLKMARYAANSGFQPDTWIDIAGYAGIGYEVEKLANEQKSEPEAL